jgi:hypothetical protein
MRGTSSRLAVFFLCVAIASTTVWAQSLGSLQGQVADSTGAAVVKATIEATDLDNNTTQSAQSEANGSYSFAQLPPGMYRIKVTKTGFDAAVNERVEIRVATSTRLDFKLQVGTVTQEISVSATALPALNTQDATIGDTFVESQIKGLPFLARNVVNLLTLQPGVVFTGRSDTDRLSMGSVTTLDAREGVVDGVRGNQNNVMLDGLDTNDWFTQAAFTSALPITLDSVQEFRVTTTNANATNGLVSGAQVQLATKSGTNTFHGNARWYYRTSGTAANQFFNNFNGIPRAKLQRNIGGGSVGGPIKKDRLFIFLDNEERRDLQSSPTSPIPIVASDALRDGVLTYKCTNPSACPGGVVQGLTGPHTIAAGTFGITPAQFKTLDPAGIGVNPAMVAYMNGYPHGNDFNQGTDGGLNEVGVRFNAPLATFNNVYIARVDYNLTSNGHHTIAWRGNLEGLRTDVTAQQFPGLPVSQQLLNNTRGYAILYTGQIRPNLVNSAHYGLTRVGILTTGAVGPSFSVRNYTTNINFSRGNDRIQPIHQIGDDVSWVRGQHTLQMGGNTYFVKTNYTSNGNNIFPGYSINSGFCVSLCNDVTNAIKANPGTFPAPQNTTAITRAAMMLAGTITQVNATFLGNAQTGAISPSGTPSVRHFQERAFETYLQDIWHFRPNVTVTYGLRWGYESPVWENRGFQVSPSMDIQNFLLQRIANMNAGIPSDASPLLSWSPSGKANGAKSWYRPDYKDFAPRFSVAYSPEWDNGIGKALFGGPGKSSLRLGAGMFYDKVGQPLALDSNNNGSPGITTSLINGSQQFRFKTAPRFSGSCTVTGCTGLPAAAAPFFTPPTSASFPFAPPPDTTALGFSVDPGLRTPYSMHFNLSFQRELPSHTVVEAAYVGVLGRRLLGKIDYAQYLNIRDPKSGVDLFSAFQQIAKIANVQTPNGSPAISTTNIAALQTIKSIPFFDNMLPNMPAFLASEFSTAGYSTLTPTQAFYAFTVRAAAPSWSCALLPLDTDPAFFGVPSPWNASVDPQRDGFVLFQKQFSSLPGWTNFANSHYHSLQFSVRQSLKNAAFGVNYVWSKSIDNDSSGENADTTGAGTTLTGLIQNPFDLRLGRGLSDFDLRHNINANWVLTLPFGRGQHFGGSSNKLVDALIGGWEVSGTYRFHTGFPIGISNGFNFPTNFFLTTPGTINPGLRTNVVTQGSILALNGPNKGKPIPNLFTDSTAALAFTAFTLPGSPGTRNFLRGPAYMDTDMGVNKSFKMPYNENHRIQLRADAFNVFNQVNFSTVANDPTAPATFGTFSATAGPRGGAREMEFAARYEF